MDRPSLSLMSTFDEDTNLLDPSTKAPPRTNGSRDEAKIMIGLALPTMITQIGNTLPGVITASYIGRTYGPVYLDGYTLAMLMANLCNLTLLSGLFSASDTLSPQAFSAGNRSEVGLLAMRGYFASLCVLVPVNVALAFLFGPVMVGVGVDEDVSAIAHDWYQIYILGLPFYALYLATWRFLSSQSIMKPVLTVSFFCICVIFPATFFLCTRSLGYLGTSIAVVLYLISQPILLILYVRHKRSYSPGTWPGLSSWRSALEWRPLTIYAKLGVGGIIATSEWVYWEVLSLMIGTLGVVELGVHTIPTQLVLIGFMPSFGIAAALSVRLGATIVHDVPRAKQLAARTMGCSAIFFAILTGWVYFDRMRIFLFFTQDEEVIEGCEEIWWKVSIFYFNLCIFGINIGISTGLGMQWLFGSVTVFFLWCISLPNLFYFAIYRGGGLDVAWSCIVPPYTVMNLYLIYKYCTLDWQVRSHEIKMREGVEKTNLDSSETRSQVQQSLKYHLSENGEVPSGVFA